MLVQLQRCVLVERPNGKPIGGIYAQNVMLPGMPRVGDVVRVFGNPVTIDKVTREGGLIVADLGVTLIRASETQDAEGDLRFETEGWFKIPG